MSGHKLRVDDNRFTDSLLNLLCLVLLFFFLLSIFKCQHPWAISAGVKGVSGSLATRM